MNAHRDADQAAILRVIEAETAAYFDKDHASWSECWVHAPYIRRIAWFARCGVLANSGWEREAAAMKASMAEFPMPNRSAGQVRRENLNVRVDHDMAWVTFEQVAPTTGDPFDVPGRQQEVRIMERHDGRWRIAASFMIGSPVEYADHPLLRVDEASTVVWMNGAAAEELKHHPALLVSGGRLRARDRASDKQLQASIQWAAGLRRYARRQVGQAVAPARYGALPLILGDPNDARHEICWVIAEGGQVLVSFNDQQATQQRLAAAALLYRITPAQMRLAGLIVGGDSLVDAARGLGISINTARTQLRRMFEKTGASSQTTLVCALLSVALPLA